MLKKLINRLPYLTKRSLRPRIVKIHGVRIRTDNTPTLVRKLLYRGDYEGSEAKIVNDKLRPGDRVLELGCGIGLVSLVASRIVGPDNVVSYEANSQLEPIIRENYRLNGWKPNLQMTAVSAGGGRLPFFREDNVISSSFFQRRAGTTSSSIETEAISVAVARWQPNTIIADLEGAECEVLTAADLSDVRLVIFELHPAIAGETKTEALLDHLRSSGFKLTACRSKVYLGEKEAADLTE